MAFGQAIVLKQAIIFFAKLGQAMGDREYFEDSQ